MDVFGFCGLLIIGDVDMLYLYGAVCGYGFIIWGGCKMYRLAGRFSTSVFYNKAGFLTDL